MNAHRVALAAIAATAGIAAAISIVYAQALTPDQLKYQRNPATGSEILI